MLRMSTTCPGSFLPRNNLFSIMVHVQFILNELNFSYLLTLEILIKKSRLYESLEARYLENR